MKNLEYKIKGKMIQAEVIHLYLTKIKSSIDQFGKGVRPPGYHTYSGQECSLFPGKIEGRLLLKKLEKDGYVELGNDSMGSGAINIQKLTDKGLDLLNIKHDR